MSDQHEKDPIVENWPAALEAAQKVARVEANPSAARRHAIRVRAEISARAAFGKAVKAVRAAIRWDESPARVELDVVSMTGQRYANGKPVDQATPPPPAERPVQLAEVPPGASPLAASVAHEVGLLTAQPAEGGE